MSIASTDGATVLDAALRYADKGWAVLPVHSVSEAVCTCRKREGCPFPAKHPRTRHGLKDATTEAKTIRSWWRQWPHANVAIATGEASDLLVIDVDTKTAGNVTMTGLTKTLGELPPHPCSNTGGGGFHLFFRRPELAANCRIGIATGVDVRGDGGFVVSPPSIHLTGKRYSWRFHPDDFRPPVLPESWVDWLRTGDVTERALDVTEESRGEQRRTEESRRRTEGESKRVEEIQSGPQLQQVAVTDLPFGERLERLIGEAVPTEPGTRHKRLFDLARRLKAIPDLADQPARDLRQYVRRWHKRALPNITTLEWDTTWFEFMDAWQRVRYPHGADKMTTILETVQAGDLPAVAENYEAPALRLLVGLCRELQRQFGDEPFFLSSRKAAELLGISPMHAWRWLNGLRMEGVLELVSKGNQHRASRYRYLGGD